MVAHEERELTAAYALNALPDPAGFEAHLRQCDECAHEVRGFLETTATLAEAVAEEPPAGLRARLLAAAHESPQMPAASAPVETVPNALPSLRRPARRGWPPSLAAACTVVAVAMGLYGLHAQHELAGVRAHERAISAVLSASDARQVSASVSTGGSGTLVVSLSRGDAVLLPAGLHSPPSGKAYELWLTDAGQIRPAGLFRTPGTGVLVHSVNTATALAMTIEPKHGSPQPTATPLLTLQLP